MTDAIKINRRGKKSPVSKVLVWVYNLKYSLVHNTNE
ncbi:hypothetical protein EV194_105102 [Natronoflexus pectinivorans]|uniref:Uncharacterized protein n=1 Tax=Natronoflexus pectinivorans TaxID=682526 RepID=A0A4R2GIF5_9BACT|nr:hypothetical protein EV194_105102 [Natronoflexus pectinivorans]